MSVDCNKNEIKRMMADIVAAALAINPALGLIAKAAATISAIILFISFLLQSTLMTIFRVAVYQYATTGKTIGSFTPELIKQCIVHRQKK